MDDNREKPKDYLEFSCQDIELNTEPGEIVEDSFTIYAADKYAEGKIYSYDTRMRLYAAEFRGVETRVEYCFDGTNVPAYSNIRGEFVLISNGGEYTIPYRVNVHKPQLASSTRHIKNLSHFASLAESDWEEAVSLFYSPNFASILPPNDKNALLSYAGQSRYGGNEQNVEEFLIGLNKKTPVTYTFDTESLRLEDVQHSTAKSIAITKSGWGYSNLNVAINGGFMSIDRNMLTSADFENNICIFNIYIDAVRLHNGTNSGSVIFSDVYKDYVLPVDIIMEDEPERRNDNRRKKRALCNITCSYVDRRLGKLTREQWLDILGKELEILLEIDEDNVLFNLYRVQLLISKERFNEANWYLDRLEKRMSEMPDNTYNRCYYRYLTTLANGDEDYVREVSDGIETIYANNPLNWRIGWFVLQMNGDLARNRELKWKFMEDMFETGCMSPVILCEALLLLNANPTFLLKLDRFEEHVLWHGAKHQKLKPELIEQLQYLAARKSEYSPLLVRILCEIYRTYKSPQTVASICHILILGGRRGVKYYPWYALGVESSVRVTGLYEYYMMSLELDKYGDVNLKENFEIPKMVLMYFAYQSSLDYELNAFLYAYVIRNREKYPDLEQSYRVAVERFVVDQIKLGHINENLAYLCKNVLVPQMVMDETAYAYTPLLFMHRIYVDNPKIKNIVVIHEKVNGESLYPMAGSVCMIPIYGSEYKLFLQDEYGNRFTKSVKYENKQLMEPKRQLSYVSGYMQGRLSFDVYLCEIDKNRIAISHENVKRFKSLAESPQIVDGFKKEIRTKLLRFYYDNDMIGELDNFLEDIEADEMESQERAEFIKYLISRGMFDKAYYWIKSYGLADVDLKSVARLVSKRIVSRDFEYDEFLVNVSGYIYRRMKYDENILCYLIKNYEGKLTDLVKLWKAAVELELDTKLIMERILRQVRYTGIMIPNRDEILISYAQCEGYDAVLVNGIFLDAAYEYFVYDADVCSEIFDILYQKYRDGEVNDRVCVLALLKFWAKHRADMEIPDDVARLFIQELLNEEIYFSFYVKFVDMVPELHYIKDCMFVEHRAQPHGSVYIHYEFDGSGTAEEINYDSYEIMAMKEMYQGIYVAMFQLFHGDNIRYYITESYLDGENIRQERMARNGTLSGNLAQAHDMGAAGGRFDILNDIMISISNRDSETAQRLTEDYLYQDFCVRELFKIL